MNATNISKNENREKKPRRIAIHTIAKIVRTPHTHVCDLFTKFMISSFNEFV